MCGYILPKDPSINAAPNERRYVLRPTDYRKSWHSLCVTNNKTKLTTIEKLFIRKNNGITNQRTIINDSNNQLTTAVFDSSTTDKNETTLTIKHNKKLKMRNLGQILDPKLFIFHI